MDINTCYIVNLQDLSVDQLEELDAGTSDSTVIAIIEEHGLWLSKWIPWFDYDRLDKNAIED